NVDLDLDFEVNIVDGDGDGFNASFGVNVESSTPPVIGDITENEVDEDGFYLSGPLGLANLDGSGANDTNETDKSENLTSTAAINVAFGSTVPDNLAAAFAFQTTGLNGQLETTDGTDVVFAV